MAEDDITFEPCLGGYVVWKGAAKIAHVNTGQHRGVYRQGAAVYEALDRKDWSIHWCSPCQNVGLIRQVIDRLPPEPSRVGT